MALLSARRLRILVPVIGSFLFALAYRQLPLFTGNQHTYFLWGLARAGYGHLASDWLVQQTDPVPLFSALVFLVQKTGSHWLFYALHALLAAAYALSLLLLVRHVLPRRPSTTPMVAAVAVTTAIHVPWLWNGLAGVSPGASEQALTVPDWISTVLTDGVAAQYVLGADFQPSAFGVLLLVSLVLFVKRRYRVAVVSAALAAAFHPSYLVQAASLVAGFLTALLIEGRKREAVRVFALALLLLAPMAVAALWRMGPTGANMSGGTRSLLYSGRIPHHADVSIWANIRDLWRVVLVAVAILLLWRNRRLRTVMLTAAGLAAALTALQFWTGSESLGLMFPWRASVWLVPAATAVVLGRGLGFLSSFTRARLSERGSRALSRAMIVCSAVLVLVVSVQGITGTARAAREGAHHPLISDAVRENARPGDMYLVPLGFYGFRLEAGVPIFADWKSHPYRADELSEWFSRVQLVGEFYDAGSSDAALVVLNRICREAPVTHLVADASMRDVLAGMPLHFVHAEAGYAVYSTAGVGGE